MLISRTMNLAELRDRMGQLATDEQAMAMRDQLVARFDGADTQDLYSHTWANLMRLACEDCEDE